MTAQDPRVALIHDWIADYGGAEKQLEQLSLLYPGSDIHTVFDFRRDDAVINLKGMRIKPSMLNSLPFVQRYYRSLLLLATRAIDAIDLSSYDAVFSISSAVAKGVITRPDQPHLAYINSPPRYAWGMQDDYVSSMSGPLGRSKQAVFNEVMYKFRQWDLRTIPSIDLLMANSRFIQRRIWKVYRRKSYVLYPPVDTSAFTPGNGAKEDFYVTASRMVPYKRIPLIVEAFAAMPDKRLVVIGDGPDMPLVKQKAAPNIEIIGFQPFESMLDYFRRARAFVFAAREDFGILPVEAQACGTPVIALNHGGTAETVRGLSSFDRPTGVWFERQSVADICAAVGELDRRYDEFAPENCRDNALFFGNERFRQDVKRLVDISLTCNFHEDMVLESETGLQLRDDSTSGSVGA